MLDILLGLIAVLLLISMGVVIGSEFVADRICGEIGWDDGDASGLAISCSRTDEAGITTEAPLAVIWEIEH